ncbi:DUF2537 domain-containing protein [Pseudonocardiaceae bacterium YIM PH 21723]|nr:DUF2537 domain-containing protein [Pseudonocardiaceae bacterium YIM PH 21723]
MELRARSGRAVLLDADGGREVDLAGLPLPEDLPEALQEWARVADAVLVGDVPEREAAGELITRRGRQLSRRLSGALGQPIDFADPVSGAVEQVDTDPGFEVVVEGDPPAEPTPWGTGMAVTFFVAVLVLLSVVTLSLGLAGASSWLAVLANLMIAAGLAPSVWLTRFTPVWRWVAFGVAAGIAGAWTILILRLLG